MVEVGRDLWRTSGPKQMLKKGHLEQINVTDEEKSLESADQGVVWQSSSQKFVS